MAPGGSGMPRSAGCLRRPRRAPQPGMSITPMPPILPRAKCTMGSAPCSTELREQKSRPVLEVSGERLDRLGHVRREPRSPPVDRQKRRLAKSIDDYVDRTTTQQQQSTISRPTGSRWWPALQRGRNRDVQKRFSILASCVASRVRQTLTSGIASRRDEVVAALAEARDRRARRRGRHAVGATRVESSDSAKTRNANAGSYGRQGAQRQSVPVALGVIAEPEYRVPGRRNPRRDRGMSGPPGATDPIWRRTRAAVRRPTTRRSTLAP